MKGMFTTCFFYEYLRRCNIINEKPSGFRPKHSCKAVFHSIIEKWLRNNIDNGKLTGVVFVDLSKAITMYYYTN